MPGFQAQTGGRPSAQAQPIRFTPYAWRKTGLLRSQVFLKIDTHLLICVPFQISISEAILFAVLSRREFIFFRQFRKKFCVISLAFQKTDGRQPENLILRGTLDRIELVKGKQNVCVMQVALSAAPSGLREIIDRYRRSYESLRSFYDHFAGKNVLLDNAGVALGASGNTVTLAARGMKTTATLHAVSVDSLSVKLNDPLPGLLEGVRCSLRLRFLGTSSTVDGRIAAIAAGKDFEGEEVTISLGFVPEIIEFLDDYFFRLNLRAARAG